MLNYTSLFADLEELFKSAGRDPGSFRRLMREVQRVREDLDDYYLEVSSDYVVRLEERLNDPDGAGLSDQEITLLRAYLGLPPKDPERDARLVDDLSMLEQKLERVLALKGRPLSLKNLNDLRRLLDGMQAVLPGIVRTLTERARSQRFEEAVGESGLPLDRQWLVREIRRSLEGGAATTSSEELHMGG